MYLYSFNRYAGIDRVFRREGQADFEEGDLLKIQGEYFLCLGTKVSFEELYLNMYIIKGNVEIIYNGLFSKNTMVLLHWMVYCWYSNYKSCMKLFLPADIDRVLRELQLTKKIKEKNKISKLSLDGIGDFDIVDGQNLFVFPDLWSIKNTIPSKVFENKSIVCIPDFTTDKQKAKSWWDIKNNQVKIIFTTHSGIFQDFVDLKNIQMIHPDRRYYDSKMDPRYKTKEVLEKMETFF